MRRTGKRERSSAGRAIAALLPVLLGAPAGTRAAEEPPLEIGRQERVEVQYVLLDLVVTDRSGKTVPGLERDDFDVVLDGKPVEVATLDEYCPIGAAEDPRGSDLASVPPDEAPLSTEAIPRAPAKIVLAFDYYHMESPTEALLSAERALKARASRGDRHMVVSIGQTLRVESGLTGDIEETRHALARMRSDAALYAGHYERITERRFFERLLSLFDLMELVGGRKVVVLFSGPFLNDGWTHDPFYARMASMASRARTSVYPVDSRGLVAGRYAPGQAGAPRKLARVATETGGRFTNNTNDLGLAYGRARRDSGCTYTLGFYDRRPKADRNRQVKVFVRRSGLRVTYPSGYVWRSRAQKLASMVRTASMAPELFDNGGLDAQAVVLRPRSAKRWELLLALGVPSSVVEDHPGASDWYLGGALRKPSATPVRRFRTAIDPSAPAIESGEGVRWFYQRLTLKPGRYLLSHYLHNSAMDRPLAKLTTIELPPIPKRSAFLVAPVVGLPDDRAETTWYGPIRPLPSAVVSGEQGLASLVRVCVVAPGSDVPQTFVTRRLARGPKTVEQLPRRAVDLERGRRVSCDSIVEPLPADLGAPGDYVLEFEISSEDERIRGRAQLPLVIRDSAPARRSAAEQQDQDEHDDSVRDPVGQHGGQQRSAPFAKKDKSEGE